MVEYDLRVEPSIEDMAKVLGSLKSGAPTRAESSFLTQGAFNKVYQVMTVESRESLFQLTQSSTHL